MKILALEFSSSQRSVAVVSSPWRDASYEPQIRLGQNPDGTRFTDRAGLVMAEIIEAAPGITMKPLGMVEAALKQAGLEREQIECVVVGLGPGSYTGIRVAIALAQGWQLALGVKLLGVNSISCIAAQAREDGWGGSVSVLVDAQREEFYLATYVVSPSGLREVGGLKLISKSEARERERAGDLLIGPDVTRWFDKGRQFFPRATTLGLLALNRDDFVVGEKLEPIYLREVKFVKAPPARLVP
jgi:tRNA threonylcarbamoyl adenosine modification protein YeaZ